MKKFFLPAVIVLIGAGTAFAGHLAKNSSKAVVQGYRFDPAQGLCINAEKDCNTEGSITCTWSEDGSTALHAFSTPTMCGDQLFEVEP